jgi:tol-pal system protein YbgF
MKIQTISGLAALALILGMNLTPAAGANKDMVQLQTQVQALQDQMSRMQQSFDERMGVMNHLIEQNTDNMNQVSAAMTQLQNNMAKLQADSSGKVDQISGQIQALNDSVDELKARLAKLSKQLDDMQAAQQSQAANQASNQAQQQALATAPPPDVLYKNALRDYNSGNNDVATQEFSDYLKFYRNTDLAGNAYFYLAEIEFRGGNYAEAVKNYDQVIQDFPSGNKAASASLKKGFALIELGQKDDGIAELRHLIQRYPKTNEALQARERLRKLGASASAPGRQGEP